MANLFRASVLSPYARSMFSVALHGVPGTWLARFFFRGSYFTRAFVVRGVCGLLNINCPAYCCPTQVAADLHKVGVVLHFHNEPGLTDIVYLQPHQV